MPGALFAVMAAVGATATSLFGLPLQPLQPLQPLSPAILKAAKIHGTGCVWRQTARGSPLLAMTDDRAVVRLGEQTIGLSPAPEAHDLFPFTFDRWQAGDLTIAIRTAAPLVREDEERLTGRAVITIRQAGVSRQLSGVVSCGT